VGVKAGLAFFAEEVGEADLALAQDELQIGMAAFRAGFADGTAGHELQGNIIALEAVDHVTGIELGQNQSFVDIVFMAPSNISQVILAPYFVQNIITHTIVSMLVPRTGKFKKGYSS
jgi:hypothetical protein